MRYHEEFRNGPWIQCAGGKYDGMFIESALTYHYLVNVGNNWEVKYHHFWYARVGDQFIFKGRHK